MARPLEHVAQARDAGVREEGLVAGENHLDERGPVREVGARVVGGVGEGAAGAQRLRQAVELVGHRRVEDGLLAGEVAVERGLAQAHRGRDVAHRCRGVALLGKHLEGALADEALGVARWSSRSSHAASRGRQNLVYDRFTETGKGAAGAG